MFIKAAKPRHIITGGVHAVYISDIKPVVDGANNNIKNKEGEQGIDIIFRNQYNAKIAFRYWKSDKNRWIIKSLCKAVGFDWTENVGRRELVKKWVFILVAVEYIKENGVRKKDMDNNDVFEYVVLPEFRKIITKEIPPHIPGNPQINNGVPEGVFIRERDTTLEAQDFNWINYSHQRDISQGF